MNRLIHFIITTACLFIFYQQINSEQKADPKSNNNISVEAVLCLGIEDHLPLGVVDTLDNDIEKVYLWTKISELANPTFIVHKWIYKKREMASVKLPVKSSEWRTWSSKKLLPEYVGEWEVQIIDDDDNILKSILFFIREKEGNK